MVALRVVSEARLSYIKYVISNSNINTHFTFNRHLILFIRLFIENIIFFYQKQMFIWKPIKYQELNIFETIVVVSVVFCTQNIITLNKLI